jgi:DNA-binding MarR family transcriptional regulator
MGQADEVGAGTGLICRGVRGLAIVETDPRRRKVWLTETAARRLETAIPIWRDARAELTSRLSPGLARQLATAAGRLIEERA